MIITLTEVRKLVMSGQKLDIVYGTHDEKRNTGGDRIELLGVFSASIINNTVKQNESAERIEPINSKNPNHNLNLTFNVRLANGDTRKIHWILVEKVNNKIVVV